MNFLRDKWLQLSSVVIFLLAIGIPAVRVKYAVRDPILSGTAKSVIGSSTTPRFRTPESFPVPPSIFPW
jgi:hypothetical protein